MCRYMGDQKYLINPGKIETKKGVTWMKHLQI